jgi:hypothetical protein
MKGLKSELALLKDELYDLRPNQTEQKEVANELMNESMKKSMNE